MVDHTFVHFDIPADDPVKLGKFYEKVFGWQIERMPGPMEYWNIMTVPVDDEGNLIRPGVNGGMMRRESPEQKPIVYIAIESVDEYCRKIEGLGGKVIVPRQEVPGIGWWASFLDPEGNQFAIFESK